MEILLFDTLPSTQKYLIDKITSREISSPTAVLACKQTDGIGSRNNRWDSKRGNFFASIAFKIDTLPTDMPMQSASIYFAFLMKSILFDIDRNIWLKWPNDIYIRNNKIGGIITKKISDFIVVGIGVNIKKNTNSYNALSTDISPLILLNIYLEKLKYMPQWQEIFSQFKIEFELSKPFFTHKNGFRIEMKNAILNNDGSLFVNGEKVYSRR